MITLTHICDLRWYMVDLSVLMRTKIHYNLKNFPRFRILKILQYLTKRYVLKHFER